MRPRPTRSGRLALLAIVLVLGGLTAGRTLRVGEPRVSPDTIEPPRTGGLTPEELRGRRLYETGLGASSTPVLATLDDCGGQVPAAVLSCANCHGEDGRGTSEGGIEPPDITWPALLKPYGRIQAEGRRRPPYTESALGRAIGLGLDPAGRPLRPPMPRYQMAMQDLNDLIAYMKLLGQAPVVPGITANRVLVGALLPPPESFPSLHRAVRTTLDACAERFNRAAVYGRRVEIAYLDLAEDPAARVGQVDRFLRDRAAFALVWSFFSGAEVELADLLAARGVPALGAFTPFPHITVPPNRHVFYLDGGAWSEALRLLAHAGDRPRRLAVLVGEGRAPWDLATAIEARARAAGFLAVERMPLPPAGPSRASRTLAEQLAGRPIDALCVLGPPERWVPLLEAAAGMDWRPLVLVPGSLATPQLFEVPPECDDRLVVAFSRRPEADDPGWARLAAEYRLPGDHPQARWLAIASVTLLVEALKRAGPDVTREALVTTLERFQDVPTVAVTAPVSFGPNRRIGVPGAHLARIRRESRSLVATPRPIATGE